MPRLFTGLEIPADWAASLSMLRGGLPGARWIDPENYHMTLRFIGDVDDALAHEVAWLLGQVHRRRFDLQLDGLSSFAPLSVLCTMHSAFARGTKRQRKRRLDFSLSFPV